MALQLRPGLRLRHGFRAEVLHRIQSAQILRHLLRYGHALKRLAVQGEAPARPPRRNQLQGRKRGPHLVRIQADARAQRVHQRLVGPVAAAAPAQPVRSEAPVHVEPLAAPLARVAPAQPDVVPERRFVPRKARIPADAGHHTARPRIQRRIDELHDGRQLLAQRPERRLDVPLVTVPVGVKKGLAVVKAQLCQKIQRILRKAVKHRPFILLLCT